MKSQWEKVRIFVSLMPILLVIMLIAGYFMPFEDREGRCTICGKKVFQRTSPWLSQPVNVYRSTWMSNWYDRHDMPDHEHNFEFLGGLTTTNLYSYPAQYEFERSDPLLIVTDEFMVSLLNRLETREKQIELIRAINSCDDYVRETVREHIYAACPGGLGSFIVWWEEFLELRDEPIPCDLLIGPEWETGTNSDQTDSGSEGERNNSGAGSDNMGEAQVLFR